MKSVILDSIQEGNSECYLTKIILKDFVRSLSDGYKDYEVQREIVNNTYLDNLIDTVLDQKHIPPIILVVDEGQLELKDYNCMEINEFKILDGLQRTYRLKLIWDTIQFFNNEIASSKEILNLKRIQLSRRYSEKLENINSNSKILESIITYFNNNSDGKKEFNVENCLNNYQWFEVWTGLTPQEEVSKMLILNAGHKPVRTQHQLELLFLNLIPIIKKADLNSFELIREKQSNSTIFSKNRKSGQFHFSHLITSILSLKEGKPITANVNLVQRAQSTDFDIEQYDSYFNYEFLHKFIDVLLQLDKSVEDRYKELGTKWIGREITLVGMFAALGKFGNESLYTPIRLLDELKMKIIDHPDILKLEEFEKIRNTLDLSKINIGTVNKNAVYDGVYAILKGFEQTITWSNYFKGQAI